MYQYKNISIKWMGVINITPDSFSDGGLYNTRENLEGYLDLVKNQFDILDFGAESTAPSNEAITLAEELSRFKNILLPILKKNKFNNQISIDTYKLETIKELLSFESFKNFYEEGRIIWNDVSGDLVGAKHLLNEFPHLKYVYSHNLVPERNLTSNHMNYCETSLNLNGYFSGENHILDPCFGFSKTREQNIALLNNLPELIGSLTQKNWLIGISRKSFLRFMNLPKSDPDLIFQTELNQVMYISRLIRKLSKLDRNLNLIFRIHNPIVMHSVINDLKTFS